MRSREVKNGKSSDPPLRRALAETKIRECPECSGELADSFSEAGWSPGIYLICQACAAIAIIDGSLCGSAPA